MFLEGSHVTYHCGLLFSNEILTGDEKMRNVVIPSFDRERYLSISSVDQSKEERWAHDVSGNELQGVHFIPGHWGV